ncbi:MAG: O-antigen ligase family protein [Thermoflexales bacterium]|nr:O-antigen ligase family protein [Thermoflexales bacterium]
MLRSRGDKGLGLARIWRVGTVLRRALGLEWLVTGATAPVLLFPTLRPTWTATALGMLALWWLLRWALRREPWPLTPFNGALLLFSLTVLTGFRVSLFPDLTIPKVAGLVLGLAVFRALAFAAGSERSFSLALVLFFLLGLGILTVGVLGTEWKQTVEAVSVWTRGIPRLIPKLPESGAEAVHPNQLAGALTLYLPVALSMIGGWRFSHRSIARSVCSLIGCALCLVLVTGTLLLTQSRSGWIGGITGIALTLALWGTALPRMSWRKWAAWGILIVGVSLALFWFVRIGPEGLRNLWKEPAIETPVGPLNTLEFRKEVWQWAWMGVQDFPLTGCGLGTFRRIGRVLYPFNPAVVPPDYDIAHAHNIFLQTALDLGIPGLVAYLALLMTALALCERVALTPPPPPSAAPPPLSHTVGEGRGLGGGVRALALGLAAGLVALHVYGLTDALALGSKPAVAFWYALGLVAALGQMERGRDD